MQTTWPHFATEIPTSPRAHNRPNGLLDGSLAFAGGWLIWNDVWSWGVEPHKTPPWLIGLCCHWWAITVIWQFKKHIFMFIIRIINITIIQIIRIINITIIQIIRIINITIIKIIAKQLKFQTIDWVGSTPGLFGCMPTTWALRSDWKYCKMIESVVKWLKDHTDNSQPGRQSFNPHHHHHRYHQFIIQAYHWLGIGWPNLTPVGWTDEPRLTPRCGIHATCQLLLTWSE